MRYGFIFGILLAVLPCAHSQSLSQLFPNVYESSASGVVYSFAKDFVRVISFNKGAMEEKKINYTLSIINGIDHLKLFGEKISDYYCFFTSRFLLLFDKNGLLIENGHFGREIYNFDLRNIRMDLSEGLEAKNTLKIGSVNLRKPVVLSKGSIVSQKLSLIGEKNSKIVSVYIFNGIDSRNLQSGEISKIRTIEILDGNSNNIGEVVLENNSRLQKISFSKHTEKVQLVFKDTYPGSENFSVINGIFVESK